MNYTLAFLPNLGMGELVVLAFLGLLIFGKKLPEVGKSLGQGIVSFKKGLQGVQSDLTTAVEEAEKPRKKKRKKALETDVAAMDSTHGHTGADSAAIETPSPQDHTVAH